MPNPNDNANRLENGGRLNGLPDHAAAIIEDNLYHLPQSTQDLLYELLGVGGDANEIAFFSGVDFDPVAFTFDSEPWYFDGETAGELVDLEPGVGSSSPSDFAVFGGDLYFQASTTADSTRVYKLDGADGTVTPIYFEGDTGTLALSPPTNFTVFEGNLYFTASTSETGTELFKIDGATDAISVIDVNDGTGSSNPDGLTVFNGELYFTAFGGAGFHLFKLDETAGAVAVVDGNGDSHFVPSAADLFVFDNALYFSGNLSGPTVMLMLDASGLITSLDSTDAAGMTDPSLYFEFNGDLYFKATRADTGEDVFKLDGATGAITPLEVAVGAADALPSEFISAGGGLFVVASTAATGQEVFRLNETTNLWEAVDINPGANTSLPSDLTAYLGNLYVNANDGVNGVEVYQIDGGTGAFVRIEEVFETQTGFDEFTLLGSVNDKLVLAGDFTNPGLFAYDGATVTAINQDLFLISQFTVDEGDFPII